MQVTWVGPIEQKIHLINAAQIKWSLKFSLEKQFRKTDRLRLKQCCSKLWTTETNFLKRAIMCKALISIV